MDLYQALFDVNFLRALSVDLEASCKRLAQVEQTDIYGGNRSQTQTSCDELLAALPELTKEGAPLHELQFMFLTVMYISDSLVRTVQTGTPTPVFNAFFFGAEGIPEFRQRFEWHLLGQYKKVDSSSSRKVVQAVAKTPLEAVISEVLLLVVLYGSR